MDQLQSKLFRAVTLLQNGQTIECETMLLFIKHALNSATCSCPDVSSSNRSSSTKLCCNCTIKRFVDDEVEKYLCICHVVGKRQQLIEADSLAESGNYAEAILRYQRIATDKLSPDEKYQISYNKAVCHYALDRWDKSFESLQDCIEVRGKCPQAHYLLGVIAHKQRRLNTSVFHFDKSSRIIDEIEDQDESMELQYYSLIGRTIASIELEDLTTAQESLAKLLVFEMKYLEANCSAAQLLKSKSSSAGPKMRSRPLNSSEKSEVCSGCLLGEIIRILSSSWSLPQQNLGTSISHTTWEALEPTLRDLCTVIQMPTGACSTPNYRLPITSAQLIYTQSHLKSCIHAANCWESLTSIESLGNYSNVEEPKEAPTLHISSMLITDSSPDVRLVSPSESYSFSPSKSTDEKLYSPSTKAQKPIKLMEKDFSVVRGSKHDIISSRPPLTQISELPVKSAGAFPLSESKERDIKSDTAFRGLSSSTYDKLPQHGQSCRIQNLTNSDGTNSDSTLAAANSLIHGSRCIPKNSFSVDTDVTLHSSRSENNGESLRQHSCSSLISLAKKSKKHLLSPSQLKMEDVSRLSDEITAGLKHSPKLSATSTEAKVDLRSNNIGMENNFANSENADKDTHASFSNNAILTRSSHEYRRPPQTSKLLHPVPKLKADTKLVCSVDWQDRTMTTADVTAYDNLVNTDDTKSNLKPERQWDYTSFTHRSYIPALNKASPLRQAPRRVSQQIFSPIFNNGAGTRMDQSCTGETVGAPPIASSHLLSKDCSNGSDSATECHDDKVFSPKPNRNRSNTILPYRHTPSSGNKAIQLKSPEFVALTINPQARSVTTSSSTQIIMGGMNLAASRYFQETNRESQMTESLDSNSTDSFEHAIVMQFNDDDSTVAEINARLSDELLDNDLSESQDVFEDRGLNTNSYNDVRVTSELRSRSPNIDSTKGSYQIDLQGTLPSPIPRADRFRLSVNSKSGLHYRANTDNRKHSQMKASKAEAESTTTLSRSQRPAIINESNTSSTVICDENNRHQRRAVDHRYIGTIRSVDIFDMDEDYNQ